MSIACFSAGFMPFTHSSGQDAHGTVTTHVGTCTSHIHHQDTTSTIPRHDAALSVCSLATEYRSASRQVFPRWDSSLSGLGARVTNAIDKLKALNVSQDMAVHGALIRHLQFSPSGRYLVTLR
ncbi:hypothetical protein BS17DRAFT_821255 [Gyrodon lividus]|nr:hypothetical protein BS17DRAFT_821255 [Gyrodon lividus]